MPRTEVIAISVDASMQDVIRTLRRYRHSRFPVYEGTIDNVIGVLSAKDLVGLRSATQSQQTVQSAGLRRLLRPPVLVPESGRGIRGPRAHEGRPPAAGRGAGRVRRHGGHRHLEEPGRAAAGRRRRRVRAGGPGATQARRRLSCGRRPDAHRGRQRAVGHAASTPAKSTPSAAWSSPNSAAARRSATKSTSAAATPPASKAWTACASPASA